MNLSRLTGALRLRKIDRCPVAAAEARDLDRHLFAFETRREAEYHDDSVGARRDVHRLSLERFMRRRPQQLELRLAI